MLAAKNKDEVHGWRDYRYMPMFPRFPTVRIGKNRRSRVKPEGTTGSQYPL